MSWRLSSCTTASPSVGSACAALQALHAHKPFLLSAVLPLHIHSTHHPGTCAPSDAVSCFAVQDLGIRMSRGLPGFAHVDLQCIRHLDLPRASVVQRRTGGCWAPQPEAE